LPRRPRLRPLSIFLLKDGLEAWGDALREENEIEMFDLRRSAGVDGVFVVRDSNPHAPWWRSYVDPHLRDELAGLTNASTAGVLFLDAAGHSFAFTFGYGRHLLDPEWLVPDFGLRVVLNTVEPDQLKSVDARTIDEFTMHTRRDLSTGSSFGAFGLDVARDLVRAVTGPPRDESLGRRMTGADALSLSSRAQIPELGPLCERLAAAYQASDYKERFGWIDHLRPVKDPVLRRDLDEVLIADIRERKLTDLHLAPPETIEWRRAGGFTYSTGSSGLDDLDPDPRITAYLETIDDPAGLELDDLKSARVIAMDAESGYDLDRWSVYRCIVVRDRPVIRATGGGVRRHAPGTQRRAAPSRRRHNGERLPPTGGGRS
jgi:uncharacterized protein (TIGR04141 family)